MENQQTPSDPNLDACKWHKEINAALKGLENWHEQATKIDERYLDRRINGDEGMKKYNLFTTNTGILLSTLYARFPKPVVTRQFEDENDDVARVAGVMIERCLEIKDLDDFDSAMRHAVQDWLVPGMGQLWLRYEPTIVKVEIPPEIDPMTGQPIGEPQTMDKITNEEVVTDYVYWKDFLWSPARVWEEVRWVGRRVKMTQIDVQARFGPEIASQLQYDAGVLDSKQQNIEENKQIIKYATIFEIWDKTSRKIFWVTLANPVVLDYRDDPLKLEEFWPCPKPLFALNSTTSLVPRPDFLMVQDQYQELDQVNHRINMLVRAVKVVGVYDKTNNEIKRILNEDLDNQLIPATNFSQFAERGGFKGMIDWMPLADIITAIDKLRGYRQDLISQIYELTGISDIMRGSSKASETLGAQQLKAQYGSVKLQHRQMDVASFAQWTLNIKAKIMVSRFLPETIRMRSNIDRTVDAPLAEQALQLMKDPTFKFRIEVHADSMAVPEFNAERDGRMGYIRSVAEFITGITPLVEKEPGSAPFFLKMLSWAAASFRTGRTIEGVLDQAIAAIEKKASLPPPPPDPKKIADTQKTQAETVKITAEAVGQSIENDRLSMTPPENPESTNPPTM